MRIVAPQSRRGRREVPAAVRRYGQLTVQTWASSGNRVKAPNLEQGDLVRITRGPFENFEGRVIEIVTEQRSITVNLAIYGKTTAVEFEASSLERLGPPRGKVEAGDPVRIVRGRRAGLLGIVRHLYGFTAAAVFYASRSRSAGRRRWSA